MKQNERLEADKLVPHMFRVSVDGKHYAKEDRWFLTIKKVLESRDARRIFLLTIRTTDNAKCEMKKKRSEIIVSGSWQQQQACLLLHFQELCCVP